MISHEEIVYLIYMNILIDMIFDQSTYLIQESCTQLVLFLRWFALVSRRNASNALEYQPLSNPIFFISKILINTRVQSAAISHLCIHLTNSITTLKAYNPKENNIDQGNPL